MLLLNRRGGDDDELRAFWEHVVELMIATCHRMVARTHLLLDLHRVDATSAAITADDEATLAVWIDYARRLIHIAEFGVDHVFVTGATAGIATDSSGQLCLRGERTFGQPDQVIHRFIAGWVNRLETDRMRRLRAAHGLPSDAAH